MSSSYNSYYQDKGAYAPRPSTGSSSTSASNYAQSSSSRRYGSKPTVKITYGGPSNDPNTSTSASNSGYYK
ncbi:hypothetical protein E8E11_001201 [Didymella keratinophila]|nr:hypothetical protein E8E11_001201 [Didymella keratinophila]